MKRYKLPVILLLLFANYTLAYQPTAGELHQNPALCSYGYNSNCSSGNGYGSTSPRVEYLPSKYGAISVGTSKNGRTEFFSTYDEDSARKAKQVVIAMCKKKGAVGCRIAADYANQCISATVGTKNKLYYTYFGFALSPNAATRDAFEKCERDNAADCDLFIKAECSLPY